MAIEGRFFLILIAIICVLILLIVAFFILFVLKLIRHLNLRVSDHTHHKPLPLLPQHRELSTLLFLNSADESLQTTTVIHSTQTQSIVRDPIVHPSMNDNNY